MGFDWGRMADATQGAFTKGADRYRQRVADAEQDERAQQRFMFETAISDAMYNKRQHREQKMRENLIVLETRVWEEKEKWAEQMRLEIDAWGSTSGADYANGLLESEDETERAKGEALLSMREALEGGQSFSDEEMEQMEQLTEDPHSRMHFNTMNQMNEDRDRKIEQDEGQLEYYKKHGAYLDAQTRDFNRRAAAIEEGTAMTQEEYFQRSNAINSGWGQVMQGEPYKKFMVSVYAMTVRNPETGKLDIDFSKGTDEQRRDYAQFQPVLESFESDRALLDRLFKGDGETEGSFDQWLFMNGYVSGPGGDPKGSTMAPSRDGFFLDPTVQKPAYTEEEIKSGAMDEIAERSRGLNEMLSNHWLLGDIYNAGKEKKK